MTDGLDNKGCVQCVVLVLGLIVLLIFGYWADQRYKKQIVKDAIREMKAEEFQK